MWKSWIKNSPEGSTSASTGIFSPSELICSGVNSPPTRPDRANKCKIAFVEPPTECKTLIAFRKEAGERIFAGVKSSFTILTISRPEFRAASARSGVPEGIVEVPGIANPSVSIISATELAVPIVLHDPKPQFKQFSNSFHSVSDNSPERNASQLRQRSVPVPTRFPLKKGAGRAPPITIIVGKFALNAPINEPGTLLSQLASNTTPSNG